MKIAVLGASGAVGAPTSFYLATERLADEIVMIGGKRQNILEQHVMDLSTAVAARGVKVRAGTYDDLPGSRIVINAAGLHIDGPQGSQAMLQANVPLMRDIALQIKRHCPEAIVINASNPLEPLNYAIYLAGGFARRQVIGYSLNDTFRLCELTAEAYGVETACVQGVVMGEHGPTQVPLFSSIRIDGRPMKVTTEIQQRILDKGSKIIPKLQALNAGRTAGWTCAVGLAAFVRAIAQDSGEMLPCSLILDGEYNQRGLSMGVPAHIGGQGVRDIPILPLEPDEKRQLALSVEKIKGLIRYVEDTLGNPAR